VAFTEVPAPGAAAIGEKDLEPERLPDNGSTIDRALNFADSELTDLQRDIVLGIAIPLRTGWKVLRRVREHPILKPLVRLLDLFPRRRLEPRRP
jgi:hypothetical protein